MWSKSKEQAWGQGRSQGQDEEGCESRVLSRTSLPHMVPNHLHICKTGWALSRGLEGRAPVSLSNCQIKLEQREEGLAHPAGLKITELPKRRCLRELLQTPRILDRCPSEQGSFGAQWGFS